MRLLDYNIAAPEGAVSVSGGYSIQGYKGGGKGGGGGSTRTPTEDQDNLHSIAYASVIDLVSAGPIHGFVDQSNPLRSVYLDSTPIQNEDGRLNFQDVQLEFRAGTQDQRYIPGFPAVESTTSVNVELRSDQPFTRAIQNVHISGVRVGLSVRGLKQQSTETGDISGYRVEYVMELSTDGSAFAEVLRGAFDGKTTQQYSRSHRIDLPRANTGWSVRVRRITPNSSNSTISDVTYVDSITEVTDAKLRRPMSACVGIRVNAKQFQSIPTRAYHLYLRVVRVPSNYDAWTRSYAGTWDGTFKMSWTDNPAWVFYDLATNACDGLGRLLPAGWVDRWALYQIARYCDELVPDGKGGTEPRFSCNVYLQDKAEAWKVLQDLASVFRGLAYYAHGSVLAVADMPRDAVYTYSNANVVDGKFNYAGSGLKTRYTVALVSWNDETDMGRAKVEVVEDQEGIARYGVRQVELTAFGCTSQGQAQRLGRSALFTSRMETESVTFAVGLSGTLAQPGQVIEVADAHLAGRRIGGLIKSATVNAVTLDAPARVSAGDRLTVVLPSGVSQTRTVAASVGQGAELQVIPVATSFSQAPQAEAAWSISAPDLATQKYRVLTVSEGPGLQHTITALQYVDGKHAAIDYETRVETPPISVVPPPVQNLPANVVITSYHVLAQGQARHNAVISWDAAANAVAYEVQWRRDNSEWVSMPRTGSTSVEVPNIYAGGYVARVRAINVLDVSSLWATSALTQLNGEVSAPQPVTHLVTASIPWGIRLSWGFPAGPNIIERTEIRYSASPQFADSRPAGGFAYPTDSFEQTGLAINTEHFFWARLVDKNGTLGPWYPAESALGVRGTPSQDAQGYNDLITPEIVGGALGELIMGDIRDIPNIRDAVGEINIDLGELNGRVDQINGQVQELLNAGEWDVGAAYAVGTVVFADGQMYRAKTAVPAGTPITSTAHWELIGDYASITDGLAALAVQAQETISRVKDAEGRIQANAENISTVAGQVNNPETGLGALGSAVQSMRVQVGQLQDGLQSLSETTTALSSRVDGIDWAQDAIADAVSSLTTRVTTTEGRIDSQASSITQLTGRVDGLVAPAGNLLKNSNVERVRAPEAYAMGGYNAIRPLENGKTYTLVSCITHQPAEGDTASSVGAWAGSGSQAISTSLAKNAVREVSVRKFVRSGQNLSSTLVSFYYFPNTVKTGNATVHWACLYEGDVVPPLEWQPSIEELNSGLAANVEAVGGLKTRVEATEGGLTTQGQSITKIDARLMAGQDSDSLLPDYLMANPDCWFSHYGTNLASRFVTTETGKIAPTVFRHTTGVSWNYSGYALPIEGRYRIRYWARRSPDSDGTMQVTLKFLRREGTSTSADYTNIHVTPSVPADGQWYLVDVVSEANAANKATYARTHYGFAANHTGTKGWAEVQGFRVTRVTGSGDINPNEVATAQSVSSLSGTVSQQGNVITSQGQALTALTNKVNDPATGLAAQAAALDELNTWTQLADGKFTAQANSINGVAAEVGDALASVALVQNALAETNGKLSATTTLKTEVHSGGKSYVSGMSMGVIVEQGKPVQSEILFLADRFGFLNLANGVISAPFVIQNGQVFISQAFIGQSWIKSASIQSIDANKIETANLAAKLATIGTAYITAAHIHWAQIQSVHIVNASIDTLKIAGNAVAIHAGASAGAVTSGGSFRDIGVGVNLPYGGDVTIVAAIQSTVVQAAWADTSELFIDGSIYATIGCITDSTRSLMIGGTVVFKGWLGAGSHWIVLRQKLSWNGMLGHSGFTAAGISVICGMR